MEFLDFSVTWYVNTGPSDLLDSNNKVPKFKFRLKSQTLTEHLRSLDSCVISICKELTGTSICTPDKIRKSHSLHITICQAVIPLQNILLLQLYIRAPLQHDSLYNMHSSQIRTVPMYVCQMCHRIWDTQILAYALFNKVQNAIYFIYFDFFKMHPSIALGANVIHWPTLADHISF